MLTNINPQHMGHKLEQSYKIWFQATKCKLSHADVFQILLVPGGQEAEGGKGGVKNQIKSEQNQGIIFGYKLSYLPLKHSSV